VLNRGKAQHHVADNISDGLCNRIFCRSDGGQPACCLEHFVADFAALGAEAIEQMVVGSITNEALRSSVVTQAQRSNAAVKKQTTGVTPDGLPVHSFRSLLADLATLARNTVITAIAPLSPLTVLTRPTPIQQKAFDLLGIRCAQ
jgi:hypothetical protein